MLENSSVKTVKPHTYFHYSRKYTSTGVGSILLKMFNYKNITPFNIKMVEYMENLSQDSDT